MGGQFLMSEVPLYTPFAFGEGGGVGAEGDLKTTLRLLLYYTQALGFCDTQVYAP